MNLMQLLIKNQGAPREYRMEKSGREATVYLYDVIGEDWYGGVSAQRFVTELTSLDVDTVHLRINSPGGDVFEGRTMATALRQLKAKTIAHIDGHAASAATYIALACDEVLMAPGAFFMIHKAWTCACGNSTDFVQTVNLLNKVDESIVADYVAKTGASAGDIEKWMAAETWFTADEALEHKFIDGIEDDAPAAKNCWNLAAFKNAPKALTEPDLKNDVNEHRARMERHLALLEKTAA